ncbi:MAG: diguanylate cyclase [Proteobacteria bacterium]|nr:diguanylate cyclase [Pseudomonadota bacterium]
MENKRILIIDDDTNLNLVLKKYFNEFGVISYTYSVPPDLEKELKEINPHAVLLDIYLPKTSGIDLLEQIKKLKPNLPVIIMTGHADNEKHLESLRRGAYAFLTKPFASYEELYHIVNNAINYYSEFLKTFELTQEVSKQRENEKLNLVELEFLKGLHHMIGETEDPIFVMKNFFALIKTFISFDIFATLMQKDDEIVIQIFPNIKTNKKLLDFVSNALSEKVTDLSSVETQTKVIIDIDEAVPHSDEKDFTYIISDLSTKKRVYGYAGLFRSSSFTLDEQVIFNRFCSHISLTHEKIRLFSEIKALSMHDGLTGVYNHAYIIKALEEEIERSTRYGSKLTIALFDIDDFKKVNDTCGHLAGDYALKRIAEILKDGLRIIDMVGRYGGDEFLVILPETFLEQGAKVCERLIKDIESESFVYENKSIKITASGGIAPFSHRIDVKKFIKLADENMYKAKNTGKNRVYYDKC